MMPTNATAQPKRRRALPDTLCHFRSYACSQQYYTCCQCGNTLCTVHYRWSAEDQEYKGDIPVAVCPVCWEIVPEEDDWTLEPREEVTQNA